MIFQHPLLRIRSNELNRQHSELIQRFEQSVKARTQDKVAYDAEVAGFGQANEALGKQLDKLIAGRQELEQAYAQERTHYTQRLTELAQQPENIPAALLEEVKILREQVDGLQEDVRAQKQYADRMEEQKNAYKDALDEIFTGIVVGIPYEELADPKAQKAVELKAKAESDKMIANLAAQKLQELQAKGLVSIDEIRAKLDQKIEAMMQAANQQKKPLKAEPPQKK